MRLESNKSGQRWVLGDREAEVLDLLRKTPAGETPIALRGLLGLSRTQMAANLKRLVRYGLARRIPERGGAISVWQAWTPEGWPSKRLAVAKHQNETKLLCEGRADYFPRVAKKRANGGESG